MRESSLKASEQTASNIEAHSDRLQHNKKNVSYLLKPGLAVLFYCRCRPVAPLGPVSQLLVERH